MNKYDSIVHNQARFGWSSNFPYFSDTAPIAVPKWLEDFIRDASFSQKNAWRQLIPRLQNEVNEVLLIDPEGEEYNAILEYELPMESRRPDVILLAKQAVIVLELKGKSLPSQADIDQADAYAWDLRCYHRESQGAGGLPQLLDRRNSLFPASVDPCLFSHESNPNSLTHSLGQARQEELLEYILQNISEEHIEDLQEFFMNLSPDYRSNNMN